MPLDIWTVIDFLCSICNIICFTLIRNMSSDKIRDPVTGEISSKKLVYDIIIIVVVIVGWLRFFGYFLVIRRISKLIMTLVKMLSDTLSFIFLFSCYLILVTTVFTTLFSNANPDEYGTIGLTLRTLYDAFIGQYDYEVTSNYEISFSILMMIHVFIANIFLLNYLIAILATVYESMFEGGEFQYKSSKYKFIEKYSVPLRNEDNYYELVL